MDYAELRELINNHPKYPGCVRRERSPLINPGFPGTFNISYTEDPWLQEYGRFVDFDHDFIFSTIQSCIRHDDIRRIGTEDSWKYLGSFEIGDLTGSINLKDKPDYETLQRSQVLAMISFLTTLGISREKIHPTYCAGGKVVDITQGKYAFDYTVPPDSISRQAFLEGGIPEANIGKDTTRDTLLALHVFRPTGWGYRNEINVDIGERGEKRLLDVGTIEYLLWQPIFSGEEEARNIVGLTEFQGGMSIAAVGLERLSMCVNGLERIQDIDCLAPFYARMEKMTGQQDYLAGESIRALHRLYSDIYSYNIELSRHQKKKIRKLLQYAMRVDLPSDNLRDLLLTHAETRPWHENLNAGIPATLERIEQYRSATT